MENKKVDTIICLIGLCILVAIVMYISFTFFRANNILNSNEIITRAEDIKNKQYTINNSFVNAEKEIVYKEVDLSSYSSTLYDNSENRVFNITKATSILNGTTIAPGQEFSFNNTIGPMGEENGYKKSIGFDANGKNIQVSGGGMCQVSSTLYNVALLANLEITERHAHSRRVNYVPIDKDATVYYGSLDLRFLNNTPNTLKIYASNDNYTVNIKLVKIEQSN